MSDTPTELQPKKDAAERIRDLEDQCDFAWSEMERRGCERDEARQALREIRNLVQRSAAWDTPNNVSGSLVAIEDICEEVME